MKVDINDLAQVKGIGKKTLERIEEELVNNNDKSNDYQLDIEFEPNNIYHGDCFNLLRGLDENSIDSVVTDPPYNLSFMGKDWDTVGTPRKFQEWNQEWGELALKVLKPGGYALVFGGTRTYHRMVSGLEDAGFEIKDCISYLYGQGFPKNRNIWKQDIRPQIEKQLREQGVEGEIEWKKK